jgi:hypothetical protein
MKGLDRNFKRFPRTLRKNHPDRVWNDVLGCRVRRGDAVQRPPWL